MKDKQIMIDGIDVSGCENYGETMAKTHNCTLYDDYLRPCKGTDCYYKNWQRKEKECEELKNDNHTLLVTRQKLLNDLWIAEESLKDFKEICDKQCEQLEAYKMEADEGKEINAELKAENEELKKTVMQKCPQCGEIYLNPIGAKLYETLTEIKEIAEPYNHYSAHAPVSGYSDILQKISECEGE